MWSTMVLEGKTVTGFLMSRKTVGKVKGRFYPESIRSNGGLSGKVNMMYWSVIEIETSCTNVL